jgi:DUF1680 family protein
VTNDKKHLDLAAYFINERGRRPHYFDMEASARGDDPKNFWAKTYEYNQSHKPVREQEKVVGHAVRAMYMYAAMADLAAEFGDDALKCACERLWRDVTSKRMYVTGGLGPSAANEGFTQDYDLPNDTAYAETCASVALIFWAKRMLNLDLDGAYADIMEQALYNGALSGLSVHGTRYFYQNPLESDGSHTRWDWHPCPCCTMNVSRLVASIGGYFYSIGPDVAAVHLYGGNTAHFTIHGTRVVLRQVTGYPWDGNVSIELDPAEPTDFALKLRIPGWARSAAIAVNGRSIEKKTPERGYVEIRRKWRQGDVVVLDFPMPAERVYASPKVKMDVGRVALKRGPLVYCLEQADNSDSPVELLRLPRDAEVDDPVRDDSLGGFVRIIAKGRKADMAGGQALYTHQPPEHLPTRLSALPYYLWSNRGPNGMTVWIPEL